MPREKSSARSKDLLALMIGLVLACAIAEIFLRLTTTNIFTHMSVVTDEIPRGIRLNWPMHNHIDVTGLYDGAGKTDFTVEEERYIYPGYDNTGQDQILFFGGSTTEASMVPEGARFPDLIGQSIGLYPMNYGRSGNASIESLINLEYLQDKYSLRPRIVFLLHGWNDYGIFLRSGNPAIIMDRDALIRLRNGSRNQEFIKKRVNAFIRKSYLVSTLYTGFKAAFGDSYQENLLKDARAQSKSTITNREFEEFVASAEFRAFLDNRKQTYLEFIRQAKQTGARVVLFTQPASFSETYRSATGEEIRIFPKTTSGGRMDLQQARKLQDYLSENTRAAAREGNALLVDLDRHFSSTDVTPLIYDTLHYTEQGSRLIAQLTVDAIRSTNFLGDDRWLD